MNTFTIERGRLCNQLIRNLCISILAEKFDLYVNYSSHDKINLLGINLYVGKKKFNKYTSLNDDNFFKVLNQPLLHSNLDPNASYFQTKEITNFLFNYLNSPKIKYNIIEKNPFKERYNSNNDCLIHIRLTDASEHCPSYDYFNKAINNIIFNKLYISTDDINHEIIKKILNEHNAEIIDNYDEVETIQFSSTCKNIILSHGTFSAVIGYLAFFSNVYYTNLEEKHIWHGDIFSIPKWCKL